MSFSTHWLDLREPLDMTARNREVLQQVADYLKANKDPIITDLACGTGSTQRALKPYLQNHTKWQFIDNDPRLLNAAKQTMTSGTTSFHQIDLVTDLDTVFEIPTSLITTSAFLDLVSREWLERLVSLLKQHELPLYAALSYDGRVSCLPILDADNEIIIAHDLHQQTDKGFGTGLGKDAIALTITILEQNGFQVITGSSDWCDDGNHIPFQKQLYEGWCSAACEINPQRSDHYQQWLKKRFSFLKEGQARLKVGHVDIFAIPKHNTHSDLGA